MASDENVRTQIRLPAELHRRLVQAAEQSGRSFNGEMVARLDESDGVDQERVRMQLALDAVADALSASQRMLSLTGFYLRNCAQRVPRESEETRELMDNIERFANSLYHGDMDPSSLARIVDMGVRSGIIDPGTRQTKPEYKIDHPDAAKTKATRKKKR